MPEAGDLRAPQPIFRVATGLLYSYGQVLTQNRDRRRVLGQPQLSSSHLNIPSTRVAIFYILTEQYYCNEQTFRQFILEA